MQSLIVKEAHMSSNSSTTLFAGSVSSPVIVKPSARTLATVVAIACAVVLPQVCHLAGAALGLGSGIGQTLLPMFLPVMIVGILAGPAVGLVSGLVAPIVSSLLTGMPLFPLPLLTMIPEVGMFGLACGLLAGVRLPRIVKVLIAEAEGYLTLFVGLLIISGATGSLDLVVTATTVGATIAMGFPGLVIQWIVLPLVMRATESHAD
jgi:hypothetical protein